VPGDSLEERKFLRRQMGGQRDAILQQDVSGGLTDFPEHPLLPLLVQHSLPTVSGRVKSLLILVVLATPMNKR
jgi:hypothetical protein